MSQRRCLDGERIKREVVGSRERSKGWTLEKDIIRLFNMMFQIQRELRVKTLRVA